MLTPLDQMPDRAFHLAHGKLPVPLRCSIAALGLSSVSGQTAYFFDNEHRNGDVAFFQWTLSGAGRFRDKTSGAVYDLPRGALFLAPCGSPTQYWLPKSAKWRFLWAMLQGELAFELGQEITRRGRYLFTLEESHPAVQLAGSIFASLAHGCNVDPFTLSGTAYQVLMELFRTRHRVPARPHEHAPEEVRRAVEYIESAYDHPALGVSEVAQAVGLSRYHFSRVFTAALGVPPHEYIVRARLRKAVELLSNTDLPIAEISVQAGFTRHTYFSNAFKRHMGQSPSAFRQRQKETDFATIEIR